ncbi:aldehyde dehydrogenase family protein [Nocardioides alcanivorans]|uniref:aldehyde dehydrogenase family protein n=1 Tax=Nocardioides alcanivorans TaxID=2897352 RepID=UPI001F245090|nr:aldehyde dehydrogenase family protein [Nocardioides alcanivorans]
MPVTSAKVKEFLNSPIRMLIDGEWVAARSGQTFDTHNPATGEVLAAVPFGSGEDIDLAVAAARRVFDAGDWSAMRPNQREKLIWRIADLMDTYAEDLGELESLDNGKSVGIATAVDVRFAAECFRYYAGWPTKLTGTTNSPSMLLADPSQEFHAYTRREPVGVCGQIIPWNFPILMAAWKIAPALATGNVVVLKPAEQTPLSALLLGEILMEAGVPAGVVNIVTGDGEAGAALSSHDDVDKIAFTGSTEVGKLIVEAARGNLKKVSLELGGKSPNIIFADADIPAAVAGTIMGFTFNSGQACEAGTRVYVHADVYDEFSQALAEAVALLKVGPGSDPESAITPLVSLEQLDRVTGYLEAGKAAGARALVGGERVGGSGYYVEPTVFVDATPDMSIVREEIFGPVAVVLPFTDEDDVIDAANDTVYGLAAGLWTKDLSRAHRVAARLKAGQVWINTYHAFDAGLPFGGYGQSGWGRELGAEAIELYTQVKAVNIAL